MHIADTPAPVPEPPVADHRFATPATERTQAGPGPEAPGGSGERLRTGLRRRHMTMIGLGGIIGAGLFVSSGKVIGDAGPAAALAYAVGGLVVVLVMRMLGELAAARPATDSFAGYARMAFGDRAGFVVGWSYWVFTVAVIAFEAVAGARLARSFVPGLPLWLGALVLIAAVAAANLVSVRTFGETEFWLACVKIALIVGFLLVAILYVAGFWGGGDAGHGLTGLWDDGGFAPRGWTAVTTAMVVVVFSFFGAEIVTIAAAESAEPAREVARATITVAWRVLIFYVCSVALIVAVVPWREVPTDGRHSPFATAIDRFGIAGAGRLMDVVVLVAVTSILNAGVYGSSRMLMSLARRRDAPARLARLRPSGVPAGAVAGGAIAAAVLILASYTISPGDVFDFLLESAGLLTLVLYLVVAASELRLRRRFEREDPRQLTVRMWLFPWLSIAVLVLLGLVFLAVVASPDSAPVVVCVLSVVAALVLADVVRTARARRVPAASTGAEGTMSR
ncbi:amino acid permease [Embleya sp. NPDC056575]|uniref:amino acid permease n=1 Tax=unclassified Embleya TaxID=2699296 RepID=UPI0036973C68